MLTTYSGNLAELMGNLDEAMTAYEHALRANPNSIPAMMAASLVLRTREEFHKAAEYLQAILKIDNTNGEAWGSLGMYPRLEETSLQTLTNLLRPLLSHDG